MRSIKLFRGRSERATRPGGRSPRHGLPLVTTVVVLLALFAPPAAAQFDNYELFGTAELETEYGVRRYGEPDQTANGLASAVLNQRLYLPAGELFARSRLELDDDETLSHELEEGYVRLFPDPAVSLSLGRQRLNWGAGYTYSATDALHPRTARADRQVGFDGASLTWFATPDLSVAGAVALQDAYEVTNTLSDTDAYRRIRYAAYLSHYFGNLQLDLSTVYEADTILRPGVSGSFTLGDTLLSAEAAVELENQALYPASDFDPASAAQALLEGQRVPGLEQPGSYEPCPIVSAAFEHGFGSGDLTVTTITEYLYNGMGYNEREFEQLLALVSALEGAASFSVTAEGEQPFSGVASDLGGGAPFDGAGYFGLLRRHYLFQTVSLSFAESWQSEHSVLLGLEEWSALVSHALTLTTIDRVDLGVDVRWSMGEKEKDEFALLPYNAVTRLSVTMHF
ncbi:MAG: hypothetical protein ACLFPP_10925 [Spirochaetaceae bacterium]